MEKERIRLSLQSFNFQVLNKSCQKIIEAIVEIEPNSVIKGPVYLPTRKRIYCVLRSPHVNKDSREQFEIRRYKRILDIFFVSEEVINTLVKIDLSPSVFTEIKILKKKS